MLLLSHVLFWESGEVANRNRDHDSFIILLFERWKFSSSFRLKFCLSNFLWIFCVSEMWKWKTVKLNNELQLSKLKGEVRYDRKTNWNLMKKKTFEIYNFQFSYYFLFKKYIFCIKFRLVINSLFHIFLYFKIYFISNK